MLSVRVGDSEPGQCLQGGSSRVSRNRISSLYRLLCVLGAVVRRGIGELRQWRGRRRAVWGTTVLPTQNRWQKVKGNAMKVLSVFAIRSKAVGKSLVQRVETKEAEAHVKTFRARNPFVKAQKQPLSFHCLQAGPGFPKLRFSGFVTERSVLAWGGLLCLGLKKSSSAGLGCGSWCRKERGGGEYGPTQTYLFDTN